MTFHPYPVPVSYPESYVTRSRTTLETALASVTGYAAWRTFDPGPGCDIDERFAAMPILTKADLRLHFPTGFLVPGRDLNKGLKNGEIEYVKTSGTTGEQVTNIWHQPWWNASERGSWQLNSHAAIVATGTHREAILASPLSVGFKSDHGDLAMEKRIVDRFLFLNDLVNPLDWTDAYMDRMAKEINAFKPTTLEANPSLLSKLCRYLVKSRSTVFQPPLIVITYELISRLQYKQIGAVFTSPLVSSYGSTETGYVFMECEAGRFHQNIDFCRVDFQPLRKEHGGPFTGRILVTVFQNPWTALVRFDVGDLVRIDDSGPCPCGRKWGPTLSSIEGRAANCTLTTACCAVTPQRADEEIGAVDGIDEYKLVQGEPKKYRLFIACKDSLFFDIKDRATKALIGLYGQNAEVSVEQVPAIAPEVSGKYRIISPEFQIDTEKLFEDCNTWGVK